MTETLVRDFLRDTVGEPHAARIWNAYMDDSDASPHSAFRPVLQALARGVDLESLPGIATWSGKTIAKDAFQASLARVQTARAASPLAPEGAALAGSGATGGAAAVAKRAVSDEGASPASRSRAAALTGSINAAAVAGIDIPFRDRVLAALNDMWACSAHHFAGQMAAHGASLRLYLFAHEPEYLPRMLRLRSGHGFELDFVYNVHSTADARPQPGEVALSATMMRLWAEFATGRRKVHALSASGSSASKGVAALSGASPAGSDGLSTAAAGSAGAAPGAAATGHAARKQPLDLGPGTDAAFAQWLLLDDDAGSGIPTAAHQPHSHPRDLHLFWAAADKGRHLRSLHIDEWPLYENHTQR